MKPIATLHLLAFSMLFSAVSFGQTTNDKYVIPVVFYIIDDGTGSADIAAMNTTVINAQMAELDAVFDNPGNDPIKFCIATKVDGTNLNLTNGLSVTPGTSLPVAGMPSVNWVVSYISQPYTSGGAPLGIYKIGIPGFSFPAIGDPHWNTITSISPLSSDNFVRIFIFPDVACTNFMGPGDTALGCKCARHVRFCKTGR